MKFLLPDLLAKVDAFYKAAGTLKVPSQLQEEVTDWVTAVYCEKVAVKIGNVLKTHNRRITDQRKMAELEENWNKLYNLIYDTTYAKNYSDDANEFSAKMSELVAFTSKTDLNIPDFSLTKKDPLIDWIGVVSKNATNTVFRFEKKSKDVYRFAFISNFSKKDFGEDSNGMEPFKIDVSKFNLTASEASAFLHGQLENIDKVRSALYFFNRAFDIADSGYLRNIQMLYALCIKKVGEKTDGSSKKEFTINSSSFPYPLPWKDAELSFTANFILEGEQKTIYDNKEDGAWGGLWYEKSPKITSEFNKPQRFNLGNLYIANDVEEESKEIILKNNLNEQLQRIQSITRHELQHFIQTVLDRLVSKENVGGLPGKNIRDPRYNSSGQLINDPKNKNPLTQDDGSIGKDGRLTHALRDVEFYTRLSDSITKFNHVKRLMPLSLQKTLARCWVDDISAAQLQEISLKELTPIYFNEFKKDERKYVDSYLMEKALSQAKFQYHYYLKDAVDQAPASFFVLLKKHQPLKYQKAVKEFFKGIGF